MVAHESPTAHRPADLTDDAAVIVEPTASAIHACNAGRRRTEAPPSRPPRGAHSGCSVSPQSRRSTRAESPSSRQPKHPHSASARRGARSRSHRRARRVAHEPFARDRLACRRATATRAAHRRRQHVLDCVGSRALASPTRLRDRPPPAAVVAVVGCPVTSTSTSPALWQPRDEADRRYAYGTETLHDGDQRRTFDFAFDLVAHGRSRPTRLGHYPLGDATAKP